MARAITANSFRQRVTEINNFVLFPKKKFLRPIKLRSRSKWSWKKKHSKRCRWHPRAVNYLENLKFHFIRYRIDSYPAFFRSWLVSKSSYQSEVRWSRRKKPDILITNRRGTEQRSCGKKKKLLKKRKREKIKRSRFARRLVHVAFFICTKIAREQQSERFFLFFVYLVYLVLAAELPRIQRVNLAPARVTVHLFKNNPPVFLPCPPRDPYGWGNVRKHMHVLRDHIEPI